MTNRWPELFASAQKRQSETYSCGATTLYCIAFVPRSGSTWLGDVLSRSGVLGLPKEWFNVEAAENTVRRSGCADIHQYYCYLKANRSRRRVFGLQLTWPQFALLSEESGESNFLDDISHWFYLRRRDYVAQAVSLFAAINSGIFHSHQSDKPAREVVYDGDAIDKLVNRIMRQEAAWKSAFAEWGVEPTELWYEDIVQTPPIELVRSFAERLDVRLHGAEQGVQVIKPAFQKLERTYGRIMCERYVEEYPHRVVHWEAHRP